jgi:hypothetical protein
MCIVGRGFTGCGKSLNPHFSQGVLLVVTQQSMERFGSGFVAPARRRRYENRAFCN